MYSHWMLKPESSGGGCLINLAPHFIDLALTFMPFEPDIVFLGLIMDYTKQLVKIRRRL